jgi:hypothetical protein
MVAGYANTGADRYTVPDADTITGARPRGKLDDGFTARSGARSELGARQCEDRIARKAVR